MKRPPIDLRKGCNVMYRGELLDTRLPIEVQCSVFEHWAEMLYDLLPELRPALRAEEGDARCFVFGDWREVHLETAWVDGSEPWVTVEGLLELPAFHALRVLRNETEAGVEETIVAWCGSSANHRTERLGLMRWERGRRFGTSFPVQSASALTVFSRSVGATDLPATPLAESGI